MLKAARLLPNNGLRRICRSKTTTKNWKFLLASKFIIYYNCASQDERCNIKTLIPKNLGKDAEMQLAQLPALIFSNHVSQVVDSRYVVTGEVVTIVIPQTSQFIDNQHLYSKFRSHQFFSRLSYGRSGKKCIGRNVIFLPSYQSVSFQTLPFPPHSDFPTVGSTDHGSRDF